MTPRLRAVVLSAGHGRRLRPLTDQLPKPLLPVCGEAVAGHTLRSLAALGCHVAVVNLHHRGDDIERHFGSGHFGMPLRYSREEQLLGTWGALGPARRILRDADAVLVANGDTLCQWPWRRLLSRHRRSGALATLLLHRRAALDDFGGGVGVDAAGRLAQLGERPARAEVVRRRVFAGAQVLDPRLLERLGEGPAELVDDLYQPLLEEGTAIATVSTARAWHDLGTPARYRAAVLDWAARGRRERRAEPSWVSPLAAVGRGVALRRSVVEADARVGEGAQLEGTILLAGARVGRGSRIRDSVLGPGVELAAADIEARLVSRTRSGYSPGPDDSVMGELVYTRI